MVTRALLLLVVLAGSALADAKSDADRLFDEGVALRDAGKLKEACEKFAAAMKKDERAIGTLLNLALCAERDGRTATAVKLFTEARDRAKEQDMEAQAKAAEEHLTTLTPQVPHLTITIAKPVPSMKVLVDDVVVETSALADMPVDPGTRTIDVSAPGYLPYKTTVIVEPSATKALEIPPLATSVVVKSSRRTIGKLVTIGGAVALAASIGVGLYAKSVYDAQFEAKVDAGGTTYFPCRSVETKLFCNSDGQMQTDRARTIGTTATVIGIVGLAAVGTGLVLWLTAPTDDGPRVVPVVGPDQVGFATTLSW